MASNTLPLSARHLHPSIGPAHMFIHRLSRRICALRFGASRRDSRIAEYRYFDILVDIQRTQPNPSKRTCRKCTVLVGDVFAICLPVYCGFDLAIYYKTRLANFISSTMQCGTPARLHTTSAATRGIDSRTINFFIQKPLTKVPLTLIYERAAKLFPQKCSSSKARAPYGLPLFAFSALTSPPRLRGFRNLRSRGG
jgi:hypothetical protein